jgi:FkbM family methyltransferase
MTTIKNILSYRAPGILGCFSGASVKDKILLFFYYLKIRVNRKKGKAYFDNPVEVRIRYKKSVISYNIANLDDFRLLEEMFVYEQYALTPKGEVRTIVDLGSNVGISIVYFLETYKNARLYGFEPTSYCWNRLKKTVGSNARVTIEQKALDEKGNSTATIYNHPNGHVGSSNYPMHEGVPENVSTITLDEIIEKYDLQEIDILKIDIEGFEYEVCKASKLKSRARYIMAEVHPFMSGHSSEEFLALFPDYKVIASPENVHSGKVFQFTLEKA